MMFQVPMTRRLGSLAPCLRGAGAGLVLCLLVACTPQTALLMHVLPDGTIPILLSHLEKMEEGNRKRIIEFEARKDWDGLAKFGEVNLAKDRNSADWWLVTGYAHSQAGRHARAIECFSEVVRRAPDDLLGWNLLAQSYRDGRQPERAVQTLNNAHRAHRGTAATWLLLGESYSDLNRDLPAAAAYRESVQMNGEVAQAWFGLGRASARLNRRAEYEEAMGRLEKLDPALVKELSELRPGPR